MNGNEHSQWMTSLHAPFTACSVMQVVFQRLLTEQGPEWLALENILLVHFSEHLTGVWDVCEKQLFSKLLVVNIWMLNPPLH